MSAEQHLPCGRLDYIDVTHWQWLFHYYFFTGRHVELEIHGGIFAIPVHRFVHDMVR
jgi:hypothetical protein